ncbi:hypothetical protein RhiirA4_459581 [Rhizophagus irregularis]|uniref:Uncharacterized protein n=1 Tax=Rhizophagus irregularis TaxID=588596 RepID=A0A2I1GEQ6_9GLOM|nr:hypothetical protein RhiirA4_459581 [Rhizophagus irregularis]
MVYDIPSTWSQIDTLNHLKAWGQVVAIKFKSQQKYVIVTVSIELNQEATRLWNDRAVLNKGVPTLVTTATLYPDNPAHFILAPLGCKAFKLIQDRGTRKLITYFESWVIGKPFSLDEFTDKALGSIDKLTILAEIKSMLRKLGAS